MSTSLNSPNTSLHKPIPGERVPADTRDYLRARAQRHAYDLVMRELGNAGITRAELSRRIGKGADRVSKMLGGPANWTIATFSELLFAIAGGVPKYSVDYPLDRRRNIRARDQYYDKRTPPPEPTGGKPLPFEPFR